MEQRATTTWFGVACVIAATALLSCATTNQSKPIIAHSRLGLGVVAAAWSPSGNRLAIANEERIWIFDAISLNELQVIYCCAKPRSKVKFDYRYGLDNTLVFLTEELLATAGMGAMVTIWDVESGARVEAIDWPVEDGYPASVAYDPVTGTLAAGTGMGTVFLARPGNEEPPVKLTGVAGIVYALQFGSDPAYLGAAGVGPDMVIWNIGTLQEFARMPLESPVWDIEPLGQSGAFLVAGKQLQVWNFMSAEEATALENPDLKGQAAGYGSMTAIGVGALVAISTIPLIGPFFAVNVGETLLPFAALPNTADARCSRSVAVTPDGSLLADMHPGITREKIRLIDPANGRVLQELNPRGGDTCGMAFSPDGSRLLIANQRGGHVYDVNSQGLTRLKTHITKPK
jgi:WD40 repeat protein